MVVSATPPLPLPPPLKALPPAVQPAARTAPTHMAARHRHRRVAMSAADANESTHRVSLGANEGQNSEADVA